MMKVAFKCPKMKMQFLIKLTKNDLDTYYLLFDIADHKKTNYFNINYNKNYKVFTINL